MGTKELQEKYDSLTSTLAATVTSHYFVMNGCRIDIVGEIIVSDNGEKFFNWVNSGGYPKTSALKNFKTFEYTATILENIKVNIDVTENMNTTGGGEMVESKKDKVMVFKTEGELALHLINVGKLNYNGDGMNVTIYYDEKFLVKHLHKEKSEPAIFQGWLGVELTPIETPKYRPFKMEEDDEYLGLGIKSKITNGYTEFTRRIITHVEYQECLNEYFQDYVTLSGKPLGKLIK